VFKPYRNLLRVLTAGMLALLLARHGVNRRTIGTVVCSVLLTFSEDALSVINRQGSLQDLLRHMSLPHGGGHPAVQRDPAIVRWRVDVDGMRCQACAARIRGSVAALPGVRNATVELAEGRVEVWAEHGVQGQWLADAITAIDASYAVKLGGRECFASDDQPVACEGGTLLEKQSPASNGATSGGRQEQQQQRRRPGPPSLQQEL
jgi:copper chaperone CopZ